MDLNTQWFVGSFSVQAQLGFNEGDSPPGRNSCAEVVKLVGNDIESWRLLGEAALASQESTNAAHGFGQLLELQPEQADSPPWSVLAEMDIGLDCFPHNSGTTLFESLWQGVPFVSLRNRPSMGRLGASILRAVGREEWIADSERGYIEKAVALAQNKAELARIRVGLRDEMLASPVCDANYFARRLEQDYRKMWQLFCEEQA